MVSSLETRINRRHPGPSRHLHLECLSHRAEERMSHSRTVPLLLLYTNTLHWCGWNSAAVITSVSSSMFTGLMSTMSGGAQLRQSAWRALVHIQAHVRCAAPRSEGREQTRTAGAPGRRSRVPTRPGPTHTHAPPASCRDHEHSTGGHPQQDQTSSTM